jgi:hypothetical protein
MRAGTAIMLLASAAGITAAEARTERMSCNSARVKYTVNYDTELHAFSTNHPSYDKEFKVRRVQDDADGLLVWAVIEFQGAERNVLTFFGKGKDRWAKHFFGNESVMTDRCY